MSQAPLSRSRPPTSAPQASGTPRPSSHGSHEQPALEASHLAVGYPDRTLLTGLDLRLTRGRLTCLLGPNGSGKTTLLRTLTGTLSPVAGRVVLSGRDLQRLSILDRARQLAVVLTGTVDVGLLRVSDLVSLGRYPHTGWGGRLRADDHEAVRWALEATGAAPLAERHVSTLSDGERQRVLIARALAQEPEVLALDEPTAFVDLPRRAELADLLGDLARECGLAILMTTHDLDLALRVADDVWLLSEDRDDRRLVTGGPEDLVLSGAIGHAFASRDVTFDIARGSFVASTTPPALAAVEGAGARALWTRRALERAGVGVASGLQDAALTVRVASESWETRWPGGQLRAESLAELVEQVRGLIPALIGTSAGDGA